jgi:DNA-binding MarR family transcriptional regulator
MVQVIGLDKSAVSRALQLLERERLITIDTDQKDARRYTVSLTVSGQELHNRVLVVALERERLLLAGLSGKEVELLIGCLNKMSAQLDAVNAVDPNALLFASGYELAE